MAKMVAGSKDYALHSVYTGSSPAQGFGPVKKYTGGKTYMFSHKTVFKKLHDPYTILINLKDMTYVSADPRGKMEPLSALKSKCDAIPD